MRTLIVTFCLASVAVTGRLSGQASGLAPNAPADRPVTAAERCQWAAVRAAIAPLVARARATYPEARRRFLAAPPGTRRPMFATTVFRDSAEHFEQAFVAVDSIVGARVFGRIASQIVVVRGYRDGQQVDFDDAALDDWMFANPDGTEEGNVVGKFLDTFAPPRQCRDT